MNFGKAVLIACSFVGVSASAANAVPAIVQEEVELQWGPSEEFPAQTVVPAGALVEVEECDGAWCRVVGEEFEGFLPAEALNFEQNFPPARVPLFEGYDYSDDGYVYGPGFAFPRFGGIHSRYESRANFHDRRESRGRFHNREISGARFHSRGESAGRAHSRAFSGVVHSRFSSANRQRQFQPRVQQEYLLPRQDLRKGKQRNDQPNFRSLPQREIQPRNLQPNDRLPQRDFRPKRDDVQPRSLKKQEDVQPRNLKRDDGPRRDFTPKREIQPRSLPQRDVQPRNFEKREIQQRSAPQREVQPRSNPAPRRDPPASNQKKKDDR